METKANYVLVGIFTLAAIAAIFAFIYWTARVGEVSQNTLLRVRIPGSAAGLGRGSAVLFNGVKVGDVRRVYIDITNPTVAIADTAVDPLTPITKSTRATIGFVGLTGTSNIEIKGGDPNEENIFKIARETGTVPEIVAEPSVVTNILESATTFIDRADAVLTELETFVKDAREPLAETLRNTERFTGALAENSDEIDAFLASAGELAKTLGAISEKLGGTLEAAEKLIGSVDGEKIDRIVANAEAFSERLNTATGNLDGIMDNVASASKSAADVAAKASGTLDRVDGVLEGIDPEKLSTAIDNIAEASQTARTAVADVAKVTEKFGARAEDIDTIISNAGEISERLKEASGRVDQVLAKLDGVLGSDETEGVIAEARETIKAFREVADKLNARTATIVDGLARFSGQGLRDVEALVRDTRRSIARIEEAISDFERNPQRILGGGEGEVRRYDGRVRR
jgi:phospholipid/cholesterol/gamma-HCH transport system substrate-binding protein